MTSNRCLGDELFTFRIWPLNQFSIKAGRLREIFMKLQLGGGSTFGPVKYVEVNRGGESREAYA